MKVLAIETATTVCGVAVVQHGVVLADVFVDEKYVHAERLMYQVDAVMKKSGATLKELDGLAVSIGPGSFTGLRIGLSTAKGLSYACGIPLVPVPTLHALAQRAIDDGHAGEGENVLAVLDARRDEVYVQPFVVRGQSPVPLARARDLPVTENILADSVSNTLCITGDAAEKIATVGGGRNTVKVVPVAGRRCSAAAVGRVGETLLERGESADVATLEPFYIKEFFLRHQA